METTVGKCPLCGKTFVKEDQVSVLMAPATPSVTERMAASSMDVALCPQCGIIVLDEEQKEIVRNLKYLGFPELRQ